MALDAAAVLLTYHTASVGIDGHAGYCLNDIPLPSPVMATFPIINGTSWLAGSQIIFTYGDLAPEDMARLQATNGKAATMIVPANTTWIRPHGTVSFASGVLTFTLTSDILIDPLTITDPYL